MTESAYSTTPSTSEGRFVNWAALLRNPNTTYYGAFPVITVTARDASGQVIATQQQTLNALPPGTDIAYTGLLDTPAELAAVEITYATVDWYPTKTTPTDYLPFTATGVQRTGDEYSRQVVGELSNPFSQAVGSMAVTALYRDEAGALLTGTTGYVDALPASGTPALLPPRPRQPAAGARHDRGLRHALGRLFRRMEFAGRRITSFICGPTRACVMRRGSS